jgi:hypothetical protein
MENPARNVERLPQALKSSLLIRFQSLRLRSLEHGDFHLIDLSVKPKYYLAHSEPLPLMPNSCRS